MVDRKHRDLSEEDIQEIAKTFDDFQNGKLTNKKGYCAVASIEEIAKQDYILTPPRYVGMGDTDDDTEPYEDKMNKLTSELFDLFNKSHLAEDDIKAKLSKIGFKIK